MRTRIAALGAASLFAFAASAQDVPKAELFVGFTYTRMNSATDVPAFSANGAGGQVVVNIRRWIGAVADLGAVHNGNIGGYHLDSTFTNFMFGPRVPIRMSHRMTPYIQALWGGVYGSSSAQLTAPPGSAFVPPNLVANGSVAIRASTSQTGFAQAYGGGLDIKVNNWVSFRPIGLDYYMMRLQNLRSLNDNNQNCLRYTAGVNFTFGAR